MSPLLFLGGILGAFYVAMSIWLTPKLGVGAVISLGIAGQVIASLALDHFGLLNLAVREVTLGARVWRGAGRRRRPHGPLPVLRSAPAVRYGRSIRFRAAGKLHRLAPGVAARCRQAAGRAAGRGSARRRRRRSGSLLRPGDAMVFNDTRVIPAALEGRARAR